MSDIPKMCFLCINYKSSNSSKEVNNDHLNCLKSLTIGEIDSSLKSLVKSSTSSLTSLKNKIDLLNNDTNKNSQSGGNNIKKLTLKKVGSKKVGSKKVSSKKVLKI